MMRAVLAAGLLGLACMARAEPLPAFYDVSGIAQTDVLNIRAEPRASATILDRLSADDTGIEITGRDDTGEWARLNTGERVGWVAFRYLARQPGQPGDSLPRPLRCIGTEPFWSMSLAREARADVIRPGQDPIGFDNLFTVVAENRTDRYAIFGESEKRVLTAVFRRASCSDMMSDRSYGMDVDIFLTEQSGVSFVSGCCSLAR